ncbi:MAG: hypothetical protein AABW56_02510 [Nanoarchaeota archaeon]
MKRYYNLKLGKPDVMGHVIEVNTEKKLENMVKLLTPRSDEGFEFLTYQKDRALYNLNLSSDTERAVNVGISVLNNGYAEMYNSPKNRRFYFDEIDSKKAKELVEGYESWTKMQLMFEGSTMSPKEMVGGFITHT